MSDTDSEERLTIGNALRMLFYTNAWADCRFLFKDKRELRAHELVLATASPVFRAMFYGGISIDPIKIEDIKQNIFQLMLCFIYTGKCRFLTDGAVRDLYYAADKYMLPLLKKWCLENVHDGKASSLVETFEFAKKYDIPSLMEKTKEMILNSHAESVLKYYMGNAQLSTFMMILDSDFFNFGTERDLFNAVLNWGHEECLRRCLPLNIDTLRHVVDPLLKKIRFLTFSREEFAQVAAESRIFTDDEIVSISENKLVPSTCVSMPEGFSSFRHKRGTHPMKTSSIEKTTLAEHQSGESKLDDWEANEETTPQRFRYLLENELLTDCSFLITDVEDSSRHVFRAHRLIVSMMSIVLRDIISKHEEKAQELTCIVYDDPCGGNDIEWRKTQGDPIKIEGIKPDIFKYLMEFVYTCRCDTEKPTSEICALAEAAFEYRIPQLLDRCESKLASTLDVNNAMKILAYGQGYSEKLRDLAMQVVVSETSRVLRATSFEDSDIGAISALVKTAKLKISSEKELFHAVLRWAQKECQRRMLPETPKDLRAVLACLLPQIRFLAFSPEEFLEGPMKSGILKTNEVSHILMNILNRSSNTFPMPEGFSKQKKRV